MKVYISLLLLFINQTMYSQKNEMVKPIDISEIISYEQFEQIKKLVIDNGETKTYCQRYNNNPFYKIQEGVELYLNPSDFILHESELKNLDNYNEITFQIEDCQAYPFRYTNIKGEKNNKKVFLVPYWDTAETLRQRHIQLSIILEQIIHELHLQTR